MKVLIHGSTGRMGKILCQLLTEGYPGLELAARVSPEEIADPANCVYTALSKVDCEVDCVIDFSHHTAVGALWISASARTCLLWYPPPAIPPRKRL